MYDELVAFHYSAYRPPIHEFILGKALDSSRARPIGLDVGCGTGRSTEALRSYCLHVVGIDPSMAMLRQAETREGINYVNALGEQIPVKDQSIDVVTFAGSLNYIDRDAIVDELKRICQPDAEVLIYDFEINLSGMKECLNIEKVEKTTSYNHAANLSGVAGVSEIEVVSDNLDLQLGSAEVVHLLLAEHGIGAALRAKYQLDNPADALGKDIEAMGTRHIVNVNLFYSMYRTQ